MSDALGEPRPAAPSLVSEPVVRWGLQMAVRCSWLQLWAAGPRRKLLPVMFREVATSVWSVLASSEAGQPAPVAVLALFSAEAPVGVAQ